MKKTTIRDVAELAGISYVTVSNVINNKGRMSEDTKKKVLSAIKKLNFYPDMTAATLSKGGSDAVAFVSSYLSSPFVFSVLSGMEKKLYETGKFKHTIEHHATRGASKLKEDVLRNLLYGKRAGAVVMLTVKMETKLMREFKKRRVPVVMVESAFKGAHSVRVDNYRGAFDAASYLVKTGRKKILLVNGSIKPLSFDHDVSPAAIERLEGFKAAMKAQGIEYKESNVAFVDYYTPEEGNRIMGDLVKSGKKYDAVFCSAGDMVASAMIKRAKIEGVKIPSDIAFIGYDDIDFGRVEEPLLTTVRQPAAKMGEAAFETAVLAMEGKIKKPVEIVLVPELVVRKTA